MSFPQKDTNGKNLCQQIYYDSVVVNYLRGLAALAVVIFHVRVDLWIGWRELQQVHVSWFDRIAGLFSIPAPFFGAGVMLFFVLSGFCIALPHVGLHGRPLVAKEYLVRRMLRIYPPYFVTILFSLLIEIVMRFLKLGNESPWTSFLAATAMIQNYTTGQIFNPSLWSLPVEVELYLAFLLIWPLLRSGKRLQVLGITGGVSVIATIGFLLGQEWLALNFAKFWILWISGAALADYYVSGNFQRPGWTVRLTALSTLALTIWGQLKGVSPSILHFGYGLFCVALVWEGLFLEAIVRKCPKNIAWFLGFLGTISYSLYLIHFPFFRLCGGMWVYEFGGKPVNFLIPLCFVALSAPLAWIFYLGIEKPSHIVAKRLAGRVSQRVHE